MPIGWAIVVVVQWLAIAALAVVVLGVLRQVAPHLQRAAAPAPPHDYRNQGPTVGARLPAFAARDAGGGIVDGGAPAGRPGVLLFLSASCRPCLRLARLLSAPDVPAALTGSLTVVCDPEGAEMLAFPAWLPVLTMSDAEGREVLGVHGRPFAVAVGADGTVTGKRMVNTIAHLTDLIATALPAAEPVRGAR